jgi:hypothetical protein
MDGRYFWRVRMLTLRTRHLTRLGATRVGVTTRADCDQSTLAFQAVFFFLFVFALPRNSLGNGLCSFAADAFQATVPAIRVIGNGRCDALVVASRFRRAHHRSLTK